MSFTQIQRLEVPAGDDGGKFGYSVAIDGDTMVVSAFGDDHTSTDAGSAYIYTKNAIF